MRSFALVYSALALFFIAAFPVSPASSAETGDVVVTLKPLHSLVQSVMGGTGKAVLLVDGVATPHGFSLKPSQIRAMQKAKIVFYVDEAMETFLDNALEALPPSVVKFPFAKKAGIELLPLRKGGVWEPHHHEGRHHHGVLHHHGPDGKTGNAGLKEENLHIWLDPDNARKMGVAIAAELSKIHPENRAVYVANAKTLDIRLAALDEDIAKELAPVKGRPFIVLHDAFPYFERRYGLTSVGSITIEPDQPPSARRLQEVRMRISQTGAVCLFREPQFADKLVRTVAEGLPVRLAALDPLGAGLPAGPSLYEKLLKNLADSFSRCLAGS